MYPKALSGGKHWNKFPHYKNISTNQKCQEMLGMWLFYGLLKCFKVQKIHLHSAWTKIATTNYYTLWKVLTCKSIIEQIWKKCHNPVSSEAWHNLLVCFVSSLNSLNPNPGGWGRIWLPKLWTSITPQRLQLQNFLKLMYSSKNVPGIYFIQYF
jgi:hypothetical protein